MTQIKKSLFPRTIDAQVADLNTKLSYITSNAARFNIPADVLTNMQSLVNIVNEAHEAASNVDTRTKLDVAHRIEVIRNAQVEMRRIIDFYISGNPQATDVDYEALNLHKPGHNSPLPPPESVPGIGRISSSDLAVIVPFYDAHSKKRAKPEGVYAIEVYYQLGGEPPTNISEMSERATDTATPVRLQFGFDDEFKIIYLAFRWIGTRGDYGPWSEIHKSAVAR